MQLPDEFLQRMQGELGEEYQSFLNSYNFPAQRALRVNTIKISVEDFKKISPFKLEPLEWEQSGFYVDESGLGKTIEHAAGLYYVQEPSAMSVAPKLNVKAGERVLDLCSAPGGKGTRLAQYMNGKGIIFLNEINFSRAKILSSNVERMGIKNAVVTCASPEVLATLFKDYFDKILVDAPCSGEGMFKKEPEAIAEWSPQNVAACALRQNKITDSAFKMLAGGGRLVYSTCTFSREEDEEQAEYAVNFHGLKLIESYKLYPHKARGEGHYYAVLEKRGEERSDLKLLKQNIAKNELALYRDWEKQNLKVTFNNLHTVGQTLYSLPDDMPEICVQTLRAGIRLGEFAGNRFEPSHSLAMCLAKGEAEGIEVDEQTAVNYLRGLTFNCGEDLKGFKLVLFKGYPLGWCKAVNGVAKNKLPKGVRI